MTCVKCLFFKIFYPFCFEISNLSAYLCMRKMEVERMRIITKRRLEEFYEQEGHADSKVALERWHQKVSLAKWQNFSDMRKDFPSADYVGNQHYVFNIKGNNYRLVVVVMFTPGLVYIRWVGTHNEYVKIDCSTI